MNNEMKSLTQREGEAEKSSFNHKAEMRRLNLRCLPERTTLFYICPYGREHSELLKMPPCTSIDEQYLSMIFKVGRDGNRYYCSCYVDSYCCGWRNGSCLYCCCSKNRHATHVSHPEVPTYQHKLSMPF